LESLVAIDRNRWSPSIGIIGRLQSEQVVAITRCAQSDSFNTRYLASRILKASGVLIARDPSLDRKSAEVAVMAIDPYLREGAFLPEATAAMGEAFEAVCNELHLADESKELRALVATRIIAAARQGEIDQFVYERRR
jgi:hypothetical protein